MKKLLPQLIRFETIVNFYSMKECPLNVPTMQNHCFHRKTKRALLRKLVLALPIGIYQIHMTLSKKKDCHWRGRIPKSKQKAEVQSLIMDLLHFFLSRIIIYFYYFFQLIFAAKENNFNQKNMVWSSIQRNIKVKLAFCLQVLWRS